MKVFCLSALAICATTAAAEILWSDNRVPVAAIPKGLCSADVLGEELIDTAASTDLRVPWTEVRHPAEASRSRHSRSRPAGKIAWSADYPSGSGRTAVQFEVSRDLYLVDARGNEYTLVASPRDRGEGVLLVPELLRLGSNRAWSLAHVDHGDVLVLCKSQTGGCGNGRPDPLVLTDNDLDGVFEGYSVATREYWLRGGFGDPIKHLDRSP